MDYSQRETRVQRLMVLFSKTWISPGLPCRWHDLCMCSLHCVAATFLFLQTSLCSQKNNISSPSPSLKKILPLKYILFSYLYGSLTLMGNIFFFLLEMHVDMGSMARLEIPKLQPMESASR